MKTSIIQLIFAILFLGLAMEALFSGETDRFYADLILANIWIAASQITKKLE